VITNHENVLFTVSL